MDYDALATGLAGSIPFVKKVGITFSDLGPDGATAVLPDDPEIGNHVGSQHAGGLFTLAETASGGAFVGSFAELLGEITPLAKGASIQYLKLAKGPIEAKASVPDPDGLKAKLAEEEKIEFQVGVSMTDAEGLEVATAVVDWYVRKNS
jgi:acyl-coenzyme A thioesterase PaaI-like protein